MDQFLDQVDDLFHIHHLLQAQVKEDLEYACLCNLEGHVEVDQRVFLELVRERSRQTLSGRPPTHYQIQETKNTNESPREEEEESKDKRTAGRKKLFSFRNPRKEFLSMARMGDKDSAKALSFHDLRVLIHPAFLLKIDLPALPSYRLPRWRHSRALATLTGPGDSSCEQLNFRTIASGQAVSHYPLMKQRPFREGDPICDRFLVRLYEDRAIFCLADGCNWGHMARKAAKRGTKKLLETMEQYASSIRDTRLAAAVLLLGFSRAHERILEYGLEEIGPAPGKTTMLGGLLIHQGPAPGDGEREREGPSEPYLLVYMSLGDCKLFHYEPKIGRVIDITYGNRTNLLNARDAGGRLGGSADHIDIRNLNCGILPIHEGDYLLAVSDGVHDNLDPQALGVLPSTLGVDAESWEEVPPEVSLRVRTQYMERRMLALFQQQGEALSPAALVSSLIRVSGEITEPSRQFMQDHPTCKLPPDAAQYPGKLDHASVVCLRASWGEMETCLPYDFLGHAMNDTKGSAAQRYALHRERQLSSLHLAASDASSLDGAIPSSAGEE